ncbi:MAG: cytochrome c [Myxococcales bacterium]
MTRGIAPQRLQSLTISVLSCVVGMVLGCAPATNQNLESNNNADPTAQPAGHFAIGRTPTPREITAWNIDIMPDGEGLPTGSGTVAEGRELYLAQCKNCHGLEGRGGPFDRLAGRLPEDAFPFDQDPLAKHTIGNYWPFSTTIFDYTRRAMPMDRPGSLEDNEVYALTAYLLFLNDFVGEEARIDRETLPTIVMPSRDRFIRDDRRGGPEIR